jgi:Uncharacterized protein involved in the oxidation of intracellular sulfur
MKSILYLLDRAPYGSENAFALLNAAAVSIKMDTTVGLYADGVYLALAGQDSKALGIPNLSDIIYAYPEIHIVAHEPSIMKRRLLSQELIERIELVDEDDFLERIMKSNMVLFL